MSQTVRQFITMDVFTQERFGGNPLAIVPDADGLDDATMQKIAAEANLSETVFIHRPAGAPAPQLRIFTPKSELPFAGHPTVGTAIFLAEASGTNDTSELTMLTRAGEVTARISRAANGSTLAEITAPRAPEARPAVSAGACAAAISLTESDLAHAPRVCDAGNPFTVIPVASREALSRATLNTAEWAAGPGKGEAAKLFVIYIDEGAAGKVVHARMFAPSIGIAEDPATGSATVALPALLHELQGLQDGEHQWQVHQGADMGRPSLMQLRAVVAEGRVASSHVGGTAVRVISGTIRLS